MTLVEFIRARLDEDEQAANRVRQPYRLYVSDEGRLAEPKRINDLHGERDGEYEQWGDGEDRMPNHVTNWALAYDPARVLREVEAKRRVLARHALSAAEGDPERPWDDEDDCQYDGDAWPCPDVLDLASVYDSHPEYDESWRL